MTRFHRLLLRLLPHELRDRYGSEISIVFAEQRASESRRVRAWLWLRETAAILSLAIGARVASSRLSRNSARSAWSADIRCAARHVIHRPGQMIAAVLCLAVGLSATLVVFSAVNTLLAGPISGIDDRTTLSRVWITQEMGRNGTINLQSLRPDQFRQLETHGPAIAGVAGQADMQFAVRIGDASASVAGAFVSGEYFTVLGTEPVKGRLITGEDDRDASPVAVVSERFWQTEMGGVSDALGRRLTVADRTVRIVGIAPAGFGGFNLMGQMERRMTPSLWLPLSLSKGWPGLGPTEPMVMAAVRHSRGAAIDAVRADLAVSVARIEAARATRVLSPNPRGLGVGPEDSTAGIASMVAVLLAAPLTLLAIGCANVANFQLTRSLERARELSVRLALGATRRRIVRLLALEAGIVTMAALLIAWAGASAILAFGSGLMPVIIRPDWHVLVAAGLLAFLTTMLSGIAPAWLVASRLQLSGLKLTPQSGTRPHARLRHGLVAVQVALSLVLLLTSALFARTLQQMSTDLPDAARTVVVAGIDLDQSGVNAASAGALGDRLLERVAHDGRVTAAALSSAPDIFVREEWRYLQPGDDRFARQFTRVQRVSSSFFDATALPIQSGRGLTPADRTSTAAVINEELALALARDGKPVVGRQLSIQRLQWEAGAPRPATLAIDVVGVAANGFRRPDRPAHDLTIYLPLDGTLPTRFTLYARAIDTRAIGTVVQAALADLTPNAAWVDVSTARDRVLREASPLRYAGAAAGALGLTALALAMAGLYSVVTHSVTSRTREFGVRTALGAAPADIRRLVIRQSAGLVAAGIAAGAALAIPIIFATRAQLVGVSPFDPRVILPVLIALTAATVLSSVLPARRATHADAVAALRAE